ncbi:MAG: hypothetical protein PUF61_11250 [Spirochaetales bacterium]|nr:hypothetical protein [Spirochaetales bacterium]
MRKEDCFVTSFLAMTGAVVRPRSPTKHRHCEPKAKQSKDVQQPLGMDCFVTSFLAMTDAVVRFRSPTASQAKSTQKSEKSAKKKPASGQNSGFNS